MGIRPASHRYPHVTTDSREADHRFCPVLEVVRQLVERGAEPWGVEHPMPDKLTLAEAIDAKQGLYRARNHTSLKRGACGSMPLSVRANYRANGDGTYSIVFQVWSRAQAKKEITRRVTAGETLAYNPMRKRI